MALTWTTPLGFNGSSNAASTAFSNLTAWSNVPYYYYGDYSSPVYLNGWWANTYSPNWLEHGGIPAGWIVTSATVELWANAPATVEVSAFADPRIEFQADSATTPVPPALTSSKVTTEVAEESLRTLDVTGIVREVVASPHWSGDDRRITIAAQVKAIPANGTRPGFASMQMRGYDLSVWHAGNLTITFAAPPVADFDVTDRMNRTVTVVDDSQAVESTITSRLWDWGDGTTTGGNQSAPSHVYASNVAPGTKTITLTVTRADGGTATTTRTVVVDDAPTAAVSGKRRGGNDTLTVDALVQASASVDVNGFFEVNLAGWSGVLLSETAADIARDDTRDDGGHWSMKITPLLPHVTYGVRGYAWRNVPRIAGTSYTITARVWLSPTASEAILSGGLFDSGGFTSATTSTQGSWQTLTITGTPTGNPYIQPIVHARGGPVWVGRFTVTPATLSGVTVASVTTSFGDGSPLVTGTGAKVHTYSAAGTYTLATIVTDSRGHRASTTNQVTVVSPMTPRIRTRAQGLIVTFDAAESTSSIGEIVSWAWDFGDGATATGQTVTHAYATPGDYPVLLTIGDGATTVSTTVTVSVSAITTADPDSPVWREALASPVRTVAGMVEVLDAANGDVIEVLASPELPSSGVTVATVERDGGHRAQWQAALTVVGEHVPTSPGDLLHDLTPVLIRLWWLVAVEGGWLRYPVGTYVAGPAQRRSDGAGPAVTVPLRDRLTALDGDYLDPLPLDGLTLAEGIAAIVTDCLPGVDLTVSDDGTPLPAGYVVGGQGTPLQDVQALCDLGYDCYTDALGTVHVHPRRPEGAPVAQWREGDGCAVTAGTVEGDPSGRVNIVRVFARTDPTIHATVQVDDPLHPLWPGRGRLYRRRVESEAATSAEQCYELATEILRAGSETTVQRVTVTHTPDPTLEPGDAIVLDSPGHLGVRDTVLRVAGWSLPLGHPGQQTTTMRERSATL